MDDNPVEQEGNANNREQVERLPALRSLHSRVQSFVRFVNRTQRSVDVFWLNYQGVRQKYKKLEPREQFKISTYVSHPWVFQDSETTAKLVVNSEEVFFPRPWYEDGQGIQGPVSPRHVTVYISIPLYTLKERATQVVWSHLRDPRDAYKLDIPAVLMSGIAEWAG
ncbi:von Hippel-Lindau disease tumor suppressor-like isoform X2 [Penaeus japonicus]|uniref:von Hippel-Lindau disease tumor suppressor-like isoform X2 n=1 Tax=Penaeus japonicus TaxID=27405 RepID=UPI001C710FE3|nr:von Hippel-Lindau disease tumor suppressor-like isoform X2 [Penaeus japonicus]